MGQARISVIVPATGAADTINGLVDHIRVVGYGTPLEIVVADGDPAGSTLSALDRQGVTALTAGPGPVDRQNAAAAVAGGDILLFLPIETRLPVGAFQAVAEALDGPADVGLFSLAYRPRGLVSRLAAWLANRRCRWCRRPAAGQVLFVRSDLYRAVGGFSARTGNPPQAFVQVLTAMGARVALVPLAASVPLAMAGPIARLRRLLRLPWRRRPEAFDQTASNT